MTKDKQREELDTLDRGKGGPRAGQLYSLQRLIYQPNWFYLSKERATPTERVE